MTSKPLLIVLAFLLAFVGFLFFPTEKRVRSERSHDSPSTVQDQGEAMVTDGLPNPSGTEERNREPSHDVHREQHQFQVEDNTPESAGPLLLAGSVRDERGNPVPNPSFEVVTISAPPRPRWVTVPTNNRSVEPERFSLFGEPSDGPLTLHISADGFHPIELDVVLGDMDIQVSLRPSPIIEGRIVGLPLPLLDRVRIDFIPAGVKRVGPGYMRPEILETRPTQDGSFLLSGLEEEVIGSLVLFLPENQGFQRPLAEIGNMSPWWQGAGGDSRCKPFRVGPLHRFKITLTDEKGTPLLGARCMVATDRSIDPDGYSRAVFSGGDLELLDTRNQLDLGIYHPAGRALETQIHPGETALILKKPHFASLELTNLPEIPDGFELHASFTSSVAMGLWNSGFVFQEELPNPLPPFAIPESGSFSVTFSLKERGVLGRGEDVFFPNGKPFRTIYLEDTPGQVVVFSFPNVGIAQAAERIRTQKAELERRRNLQR